MEKQYRHCGFDLWGGVECTLNRVNDNYFDQLHYLGHYHRQDDIERFASLGISMMRYPVLWELHEPEEGYPVDWTWITRQLHALKQSGVQPIAGLVHHGSGPAFTSLEDPAFGSKLARYAGQVARQFPWLEYYTPVNEPLTTARFSGLYGLWYPHKRNDLIFIQMLLNEIKGVVLAMREIRKVNPSAKLVQTEDLGKTYSSRTLKYQADFENERRWLTYDLLCGKVDKDHSLWNYLRWLGVKEEELYFFVENTCVPDIAGFNYYITSERYLDKNLQHYPRHLWGGNHRHRYVDTEAIRIRHKHNGGLSVLLQEAWNRFKLPMAVTEAFLSCTQDDQVRWLDEVCDQVKSARQNGVDIRAVTFWALLGEFSWNKLVTSMDGEYVSGAFDVWGKEPRDTWIAEFIRSMARHGEFNAEWLTENGWWKREDRYHIHEMCVVK
jgi:dTDP-4-dehydrorhamnose reductase